jgi:hypothetical protein
MMGKTDDKVAANCDGTCQEFHRALFRLLSGRVGGMVDKDKSASSGKVAKWTTYQPRNGRWDGLGIASRDGGMLGSHDIVG